MENWLGGREGSSSVDMDTDGDEEDGNETEKDDGVDQDWYPTRLQASKRNHSAIPR